MPAFVTRSLTLGFGSVVLAACQFAPSAAVSPTPEHSPAPVTAAASCPAPKLAEYTELQANPKLPNPFVSSHGQAVETAADWACRRAEVAAQVQKYELGTKPAPAGLVQARIIESGLQITVAQAGKSISFPVRIRYPGTGRAPYPAIIGLGAVLLNNDELSALGIALISFPNNEIGEQLNAASRGKGKFYELFGREHGAGAMMAWAWGVSRLVDALESTPGAGIDARRLGLTGCSRNGKGAIVAGAFDDRIALTIAQESGSGGSASWRISNAQLASGQNVQTLHEIVQENAWFTDSFRQFSEQPARLPFDQHMVMGLIAPRALLVIENTSMEWLGNQSAYIDSVAAREIWKALGIPAAMGVSQVGGHAHCQLPASQYGHVSNFAKKFLLGAPAVQTDVEETDGTFSKNLHPWIDWKTPALP
jgi:hypothetical protein